MKLRNNQYILISHIEAAVCLSVSLATVVIRSLSLILSNLHECHSFMLIKRSHYRETAAPSSEVPIDGACKGHQVNLARPRAAALPA